MQMQGANKEFPGGQEDWATVASIAENCPYFSADVEEEQVANEEKSCYNCRYRRWTERSFICQKTEEFK